MNKHPSTNHLDPDTLAEDAQALITATAHVAGDKVEEARKRLTVALDKSKEIYGRVREKAIEGAKITDKVVHEHPYQVIAGALGLGVLLGVLVVSLCSRSDD